MLAPLPRFLYQPPIAAPFLGPRIIPRLVGALHPRRLGRARRPTTAAAEQIYAATYREPDRAEAASQYYRQFLPARRCAAAPRRPQVPTTLLYGTREPLGPAPAPKASTTLQMLDGCGHFVPEERPLEVAAAVRSIASA